MPAVRISAAGSAASLADVAAAAERVRTQLNSTQLTTPHLDSTQGELNPTQLNQLVRYTQFGGLDPHLNIPVDVRMYPHVNVVPIGSNQPRASTSGSVGPPASLLIRMFP